MECLAMPIPNDEERRKPFLERRREKMKDPEFREIKRFPIGSDEDILALGRQPRATLYALYQGWLDTLLALQAARVTGVFAVVANAEHAAVRREALRECARLDAVIARLRSSASGEKQLARQVELNLELKRVEAQRTTAGERL